METLTQERIALLSKRDELLDKNNEHKQFADSVSSLGGLDTIRELVETSHKQAEESNDVDKLKSHYAELLKAEQDKSNRLSSSYISEKTSSALTKAITDKGGNAKLLEPILRSRIQGEIQDGTVKIKVLDGTNSPMLVEGRDATIEDLVNEFSQNQDYKPAFDAIAKSGSGAKAGHGKAAETFTVKVGEAGNLEKMSELYKKSPQRARELMREAGFGSE